MGTPTVRGFSTFFAGCLFGWLLSAASTVGGGRFRTGGGAAATGADLESGLSHGSVSHLDDIPKRSTSHADQNGKPVYKKQIVEPFQVHPMLAGISVGIFDPAQEVSEHVHETMHEFFYVLEGDGVITVNGVDHTMNEGTFIHVAPNERHSFRAASATGGSSVGGMKLLNTAITTTPGPRR